MKKTDFSQLIPIVLPLMLVFMTAGLMLTKSTRHADYALNDVLTRHIAQTLTPDPDIVIIDIDDYSLTQMSTYAGRWVWPRSVHAELIEALTPYQPQAIAFDILFSEPDIYRPDSDAYFNEVISTLDNVFFAMIELNASKEDRGKPLALMPKQIGLRKSKNANMDALAHIMVPGAVDIANWRLGSINFNSDSDGIGRSYDVRRNIQGWYLPSLPAKIAEQLGGELPKQDQIILQWRGREPQDFTTYRYTDIYQAIQQQNNEFLAKLKNKVIIVGATATGLFDMRATPLSDQYPAVYMLATAMDNLKNKRYMQVADNYITWLISFCLLALISAIFIYGQKFSWQLAYSGITLSVVTAILVFTSYQLLKNQLILYIATPIIVGIASFLLFSLVYGFKEYLYRQRAVSMFGRFLDPTVVSSLVGQGKLDLENTSHKTQVTVLFTDIRNFTTISEQHTAQEVVNLLNLYFNQQVSIIYAHKGTLDKFIGDCIMAFWGAPVANENQERDAINAALAMEEHLEEFQQSLPNELKEFDVGIGIHSGEAIVGMIGAEQRVDYTAIGDTVNLASRIEGLTKAHARILVSQQTMQACEQEFEFISHGEFTVKGRKESVKLFQPKRKLQ